MTQVEDFQLDPTQLRGLDAVFATLAEDAPSFAGIRYEGEALVLLLADPSEEAAAVQALRSYHDGRYLTQGVSGEREIQLQEVDFTFMDLAKWRQAAYAAFGDDGIDWIVGDIDEVENTVTIGLRTAAADDAAQTMQEVGIPAPAIRTEVREPPRRMSHTLDDKVRPLRGGLAVNQYDNELTEHPDSTGGTHGFVAEFSDGTDGFFVTSHQTVVKFQEDTAGDAFPKEFFQDEDGDLSRRIGEEYDDTNIISCPTGVSDAQGCVEGDVAFAVYQGVSSSDYGYNVAQLAGAPPYDHRDISHTNPNWPVGDDAVGNPAVAGQELHKTGQRTARTFGFVEKTCSDVEVTDLDPDADDGPTHLCEYKVAADPSLDSGLPLSRVGDSGSPVFTLIGFTGEISIHGILWGGEGSGDDSAFWYSDVDGIVTEFGSITTH